MIRPSALKSPKKCRPSFLRSLGGIIITLLLASPTNTLAESPAPTLIPVSIIIDDLGDRYTEGSRAVNLPGQVTYAFLPHTPFSKQLAESAYRQNKEIMVHLPMESVHEDRRLGPGGLTADMSREAFTYTAQDSIRSIPHATGLNNHMGSQLTSDPNHMQWLMEAINQMGSLYFVDSRTTSHTVAQQIARQNEIPTRRRDIFLDNDQTPKEIEKQFRSFVKKAKIKGSAIAIGHPYPNTLAVLEEELPRLHLYGLELVPVSQLMPSTTPTIRQAKTQPQKNQDEHLVLNTDQKSNKLEVTEILQ